MHMELQRWNFFPVTVRNDAPRGLARLPRLIGREVVVAVALWALAGNEGNGTAMSKRSGHILVAVIALSALASLFFGLRSYNSLLLLRSCLLYTSPSPRD